MLLPGLTLLLKVSQLNAFYGSSHVLQGVSLNVDRAEIVAILGRNSVGKSTTLKTIMGLVRPRSGSIIFDGMDISVLPPYKVARAGIGYVPEDKRIFPNLSVRENLLLAKRSVAAGNEGQPDLWTVERVFQRFPMLERRAGNKGAQLSGGEQQMLAIGRALMGNPVLLLVDEPTEGLAPLLVDQVRDVLRQINQAGVSVLLTEHNMRVALSLAHRVYLMGKGHIGFSGTVNELNSEPEIKSKYLGI